MADAPDRRESGKDMRYKLTPSLRVELHHKDSRAGTYANDRGFVSRFLEFCEKEGIEQLRGMTIGPGLLVCDVVPPEALGKIVVWLEREGAGPADE